MDDLWRKSFSPGDVERVTRGVATAGVLRAWVLHRYFRTPLKEPRAGKPREFPLLAVYEAALLAAFTRMGVPFDVAREWTTTILKGVKEAGGKSPIEPARWAWAAVQDGKIEGFGFNDDQSVNDLSIAFEIEIGDDGWGERTPAEYQAPTAIAVLNVRAEIERIDRELEKRKADDHAT